MQNVKPLAPAGRRFRGGMASPPPSPSSPVSLPPLPPPPSAYIQSWLAKGPAPHGDKSNAVPVASLGTLEHELAALAGPGAPKTAGKDLLGRVLPCLAAYDVPSLTSLETLCQMLNDAGSWDRFVVRYVYYFVQRSVERYGCAMFVGDAPGAVALIDRLSEDASIAHAKHGARQILAARALVAAARAGIGEAKTATTSALGAFANALRAGTQPRDAGGLKLKSIFGSSASTDGSVDAGARAVLGASLRLGDAQNASKGDQATLLSPAAVAFGARSTDAIAARLAWSGVLALAATADTRSGTRSGTTDTPHAAHQTAARALSPFIKDLVCVLESRRVWNESVASAPDEKARAAAVKAARASESRARVKYATAPKLNDTATAALAMRACGALAGRLAADADDVETLSEQERARCSNDAKPFLDLLKAALRVAAGAARAAAAARAMAVANARGGVAFTSTATSTPANSVSVFAMPRVALAAVTGVFAGDAPANKRGARARAAAWNACVGDSSGGSEHDGFDVIVSSAKVVTSAVLLGLDGGGATARRYNVTRAAACRAAAALGEARCASLATSGAAPGAASSEADTAIAALADAVRRVADLTTVPPGVRVEALRATLWLQTPRSHADAGDKARAALSGSSRFETFEAYHAFALASGESLVGGGVTCTGRSGNSRGGTISETWCGCDAQSRLLSALARRSATVAACGSATAASQNPNVANSRNAWLAMTLDCLVEVVASGPQSVNPKCVTDALHQAQRASVSGLGREQVLRTTSRLLAHARLADARELQTSLIWHLGENVNFNTGEYAWISEQECTARAVVRSRMYGEGRLSGAGDAGDTPSLRETQPSLVPGTSATAASRNPPLAAAVATLTRAALTSAHWTVRAAAVSALATAALRSGEPFRLQCYCALLEMRNACETNADADGAFASQFAFSYPELARHVQTLDHLYRGEQRFNSLRTRNGDDPAKWKVTHLAEVAGRHDATLALVTGTCFIPGSKYVPLGGNSMVFVDAFGGDRPAAAAVAARLMRDESAELSAKVAGMKKKEGMTSSAVRAFRLPNRNQDAKRIEIAKQTMGNDPFAALPAPLVVPTVTSPVVTSPVGSPTKPDSDFFVSVSVASPVAASGNANKRDVFAGFDNSSLFDLAPSSALSDNFGTGDFGAVDSDAGLARLDSGSFVAFAPEASVAEPGKPDDDPFAFLA